MNPSPADVPHVPSPVVKDILSDISILPGSLQCILGPFRIEKLKNMVMIGKKNRKQ